MQLTMILGALWIFQAAAVSNPQASGGDVNVLFTQVTSGAACAYILMLLQKSKALPWITQHTAGINMAMRATLAAVATIGVGVAWNGSAHTLTISNLSFPVILSGIWHWFGQYALQHGWGKLLSSTTTDQPPQ